MKHIRLLKGMSQGEFAHILGVSQSTLSAAESGHRDVSSRLRQAVTFTYKPRADYLDEPITFYKRRHLLFRTTRQGHKHDDQVATAFSIIEHYLRKAHPNLTSALPELPAAGRDGPVSTTTIEELAAQTRKHFNLQSGEPIRNITEVLHRHNILVTALPFGDESNIDGVSSPHGALRIIALNRSRSGDRYRFSLAHELGHLILHTNFNRIGSNTVENEANRFAGAFLMPRELLESVITPTLTLSDYAELKQRWGYSMQAIVLRAHELDLIDYKRYRSLRMQIAGRGWAITEPGTVLLENLHTNPPEIFTTPTTNNTPDNHLATVTPLQPR